MLVAMNTQLQKFRQRLTRLDNQPLSQAALAVIVFLDLFILSAIFDGLADHTRQLASPEEQVPLLCRDIVIDGNWNPSNRLNNLAQRVSVYQAQRFTPLEVRNAAQQHPLCVPLLSAYNAIREDVTLARDLRQTQALSRETRDLRADLERMKGAYDTQLLESIAGQPRPETDPTAIRQTMADKTGRLNELVAKQGQLEAELAQNPKVRVLFARLDAISDADRTALRDDLRRLSATGI